MTTAAQPARGEPGPPAGDDDDVDVLRMARQRPPEGGAWLLVTAADAAAGGTLTAQILPGGRPQAFGGDVVAHLTPATGTAQQPPPAVSVSVWAVMAGRLVPVAAWDNHDLGGWPEQIRPAVVFTMSMLTELEEHGADVGARDRVDLNAAARDATPGFPLHATFPADAAPGQPVS
jgi:hypothetical protein